MLGGEFFKVEFQSPDELEIFGELRNRTYRQFDDVDVIKGFSNNQKNQFNNLHHNGVIYRQKYLNKNRNIYFTDIKVEERHPDDSEILFQVDVEEIHIFNINQQIYIYIISNMNNPLMADIKQILKIFVIFTNPKLFRLVYSNPYPIEQIQNIISNYNYINQLSKLNYNEYYFLPIQDLHTYENKIYVYQLIDDDFQCYDSEKDILYKLDLNKQLFIIQVLENIYTKKKIFIDILNDMRSYLEKVKTIKNIFQNMFVCLKTSPEVKGRQGVLLESENSLEKQFCW